MTPVTLQSAPPKAAISLKRGDVKPTTILNAPPVTVALVRQTGESVASATSVTDLAAIYRLTAN